LPIFIRSASGKMWAQVIGLLVDGILQFGFGSLTNLLATLNRAHTFLKLFLMTPRLILLSRCGLRLAPGFFSQELRGRLNRYLRNHVPKIKPTAKEPLMDKKQRQTRIQNRVSVLIQSCDLSRAMHALME
jgi:hypothetical protein